MDLKLMQNEVNVTLNLGGTLSLVLVGNWPHILFVDWLIIFLTLGKLPNSI